MLENYPRSLANTLVEEGGWANNPNDPGGPTMRGVIQRTYDDWRDKKGLPRRSVRGIEETELQDIYWSGYAKPIQFERWPKGPDQVAFDIAVNSGPGRTWALAGSVLGVTDKTAIMATALATDPATLVKNLCARRMSFYRSLGTFQHFGAGWTKRNARMEALGVKMALEGPDLPADALREKLEREKREAEKKAREAGKGAGGAGGVAGGGAGGSTQVPAESWDWSTIIGFGVGILIFAGLAIGLLWLWRKHRRRAQAYDMATRGTLDVPLPVVLEKLREPADAPG